MHVECVHCYVFMWLFDEHMCVVFAYVAYCDDAYMCVDAGIYVYVFRNACVTCMYMCCILLYVYIKCVWFCVFVYIYVYCFNACVYNYVCD